MIGKKFYMTEQQRNIFKHALSRCGECVDLHGWRYSKDIGFEEYVAIDIYNTDHCYQFYVSVKFLRTHFPIKGNDETLPSIQLRNAAERWWKETSQKDVAIDNGIMMVAIVACGLAPRDLWHSMDVVQKAMIKIHTWNRVCKKIK